MSNKENRLNQINNIVNDDILGYLGNTEQLNNKDNINTSQEINKPQNEVKNGKLEGVNDIIDNTSKNTKKKTISRDKQGKIRTDKQGEVIYTKKDNKAITIKIDADIEGYLNNISVITFIDSIKQGKQPQSINQTEYINQLIRQDLIKRLGLKDNASDEVISAKWLEYKKANNLK